MNKALHALVVSSLAATGLLLLAPAANAAAGEIGSWEAGFFAGTTLPEGYGVYEPADDLLWGARLGCFTSPTWSVELSVQTFSSTTDFGGPDRDFDISSFRLNGLYNFLPGARLRPFVTFGTGLEVTDAPGLQSSDAGVNVGAGVRAFLGDWFGIRVDGRYVFTGVGGLVDDGQGNLEATAGVLFTWGGGPPPDADGDGVADRKDRCPGTPRGAVVDVNGCPSDPDGDGVFDGIDACSDTPKGCAVDARGCPLDVDGDGVFDCLDKCVDTPRGCQVDATGCPKDADGDGVCDGLDTCAGTGRGCQVDPSGCPKDTDGDGVCDGVDTCSGTAAGCPVDASGCPQDADRDGVCDGVDKCPGTPQGRKVDAKGCEPLPEKAPLRLEGVTFENDSAKLAADSSGALDSVAASLVAWSDVKVEIAGHTDAIGSDGYNLRLSERRAASVREYLIGKGVPADRLVAKGHGETEPVADNKAEEGRAQNRRVELRRLD